MKRYESDFSAMSSTCMIDFCCDGLQRVLGVLGISVENIDQPGPSGSHEYSLVLQLFGNALQRGLDADLLQAYYADARNGRCGCISPVFLCICISFMV